jgi:hypothetical protein
MATRQALRTPRAAAVAGILFSVLLLTSLVLIRLAIPAGRGNADVLVSDPALRNSVLVALNLIPFAGIAFLWFIGVVRDRMGEHEDRFFATVFLGSGLLFVAMLFVAAGIAVTSLAEGTNPQPTFETWRFSRDITYTLITTYAMRMAAVFILSTATISLRITMMPRWIGLLGYVCALVLLLSVGYLAWVEMLFPLWVLLVSVYILASTLRIPHEVPSRRSAGGTA